MISKLLKLIDLVVFKSVQIAFDFFTFLINLACNLLNLAN